MRIGTSFLFIWTLCSLPAQGFDGFGYLSYTEGHMDIGVRLVDGELAGYWKNDFAVIDGKITAPDYPASGLRALGVFDENTPPLTRPAASQWAFLGVEAAEPIYILPSGGVPNTVPYLGVSTEDTSLSALGADEYRFTLVHMNGPENGVFSLYTSADNVPMNTLNGFPAGSILIEAGDHLHFNWAFSHPGTYDLYLDFEALTGTTVIMNGSDMFRFQITDGGGFDSYDHWRRTVFTPEQISDESISGPLAAPQEDGISNMQRYAFGHDASLVLVKLDDEGQTRPGIRARMRFQSGGIMPVAEFATQLQPYDWTETHLTLIESEPIHHDPGLEIRTYRVDHHDNAIGFMRLRSGLSLP